MSERVARSGLGDVLARLPKPSRTDRYRGESLPWTSNASSYFGRADRTGAHGGWTANVLTLQILAVERLSGLAHTDRDKIPSTIISVRRRESCCTDFREIL